MDPARITDLYAVAVANQIFDGLVEFDVHLNILPALAQSWSASRDSLVWTFTLRSGIRFHNGREVVADDVVYSWSRLLDPAVRSPRSALVDKISGAKEYQSGEAKTLSGLRAVDRYTVQITLSEPFSPFISVLGLPHLGIVPREEVERLGADFGTAPVGTGPFRIVRWERGREILLEAHESHYRKRPALDRVRFIIFPGNAINDMFAAFDRGDLEESPIPAEKRQALLESSEYTIIRKPILGLRFIGFNFKRSPFDQAEVRRAFNYAIDTTRLNKEILEKPHEVARGILPPGMPGYNPEVKGYTYQPKEAKALLAQAGYVDGAGLAPVSLASSVKSSVALEDYEAIRQYMANVGVQVELQEFDNWSSFQQALRRRELQMFRYARLSDYPDPDNFLYPLFHSQSPNNVFGYQNALVDRLLEEARRETGDLRRVKLYREAEQLILNDAPGVMLMHHTYEGMFKPYVEGVEVSALGDPYIPMAKIRFTLDRQSNPHK